MMTVMLYFPKYMRTATLDGIAKIYLAALKNVWAWGKNLFAFGKFAGKLCGQDDVSSRNLLAFILISAGFLIFPAHGITRRETVFLC
jgi:hypothetical protein